MADSTGTTGSSNAEVDAEGDAQVRPDYFGDFVKYLSGYAGPQLIASAWSFLNLDTRLRIDMPPSEFLDSLRIEFGEDLLLAIGLLERVDDEVRPPSFLTGDPPVFVTVDQENRSLRFEHDGNLFPISRTALDCALERRAPDSPHDTQTLFIVSSFDEIEVLRKIGLPAIMAEGLESLRQPAVSEIFPDDRRLDGEWKYFLLLMDTDIAQLTNERMGLIGNVIERLADIADVYNIAPGRRFGLCRPTERDFEELKLAATFEDRDRIVQLLERWATAARKLTTDNWRALSRQQVVNYSTATATLRRALEISDTCRRRLEVVAALPAYRDACQLSLLAKFGEAVDEASNPLDRLELMAVSDLAGTFLASDPLLLAAELVAAGKQSPPLRELYVESFEQRRRYLDELRRLHRNRMPKR